MRLTFAAAVLAVAFLIAGVLWLELVGGVEVAELFHVYQSRIAAWVERHPVPGAMLYVLAVALGRVTPFPGSIFLTLAGGFLFGTLLGGLLAAAGAALCATLVFLVGRRFFSEEARARLGHRFDEIEREFAAGAAHYLLAMRLLPVLPGWLVNLAPIPFPVRTLTVAGATFLGLLPVALVVASVGAGLADVSAGAAEFSARVVLSPGILLPLAALSLLALVSVVARRRRARRKERRTIARR